jgi:inner membrane protease subunit 1
MIPTLYLEDRALVLTHYRRGRGVKVGDVVSAQHPHEPGETVIKRVVGMPGDFVCGGMDPESGGPLLQVPQGHCFLAGDNQAFSRDSRYYGPVPLALVRGRAVAVASKMRWLGDPFTRVAEGDLVG